MSEGLITKYAKLLLRLHHPEWHHETFEVNVFPKDLILEAETQHLLKQFINELND